MALTLCGSTLIASEFMPVSLLTPVASHLHLTEGQAGQAISISGVFAVFTSLLVASVTRRIDRRAATGGLLFDSSGYESTFGVSAAMLVGSALVAVAAGRAGSRS